MSDAKTAIAEATADAVTVRGHDLTSELMGHLSLTEMFFLLLMGRAPDERERRMTDACLVAIAEHGLVPSVQAARMTLSAAPESLQGAVAAGLLGCGSVILGATEYAGTMLTEALAAGTDPVDVVREYREARRALPGFGHPLHKDGDPRTTRLLALSDELGVSGEHVALIRAIEAAVPEVYGRILPLNVSGAIAAPMLDLGLPAYTLKAIPLLARTAGLLGHLREEHERPIGFQLASPPTKGSSTTADEPARPGSRRGPPMQRRATSALLSHLASLRERSPFYRDKLAGDRGRRPRSTPALPFTTKDEIRASLAAEPPLGRHLAARPRTCAAIYSTSGTTGDPSYIAVTDADLAAWTDIGSRSYAATGIAPGQRAVLTYNSRPVRGRRGARRLAAHRRDRHPGRQRQHRAAREGVPGARRRGARLHAVLRDLPRRLVPRARHRAARASACACSPSRGSRAGARTPPAHAIEDGVRRHRARGDGHRRRLALAVGRVRGAGRHALLRRPLHPRRADRPGDRRAAARWRTAPRASSSTPR